VSVCAKMSVCAIRAHTLLSVKAHEHLTGGGHVGDGGGRSALIRDLANSWQRLHGLKRKCKRFVLGALREHGLRI
jgi:hypothetical protein